LTGYGSYRRTIHPGSYKGGDKTGVRARQGVAREELQRGVRRRMLFGGGAEHLAPVKKMINCIDGKVFDNNW